MTIEQVAKVAHEINKAYCISIGDESQPSWDDAPEWQKESAIDGVLFHLNNQEAGADASHNNWMNEKIQSGWKYGEVKDPENKLHPCIIPFEMLPKEQQIKDYLFRAVVHSLR